MRTPQRRLDPAVVRQLAEEPHRFEFFQAVRLVERVYAVHGIDRREVTAERLRFESSLSLSFPPGQIEALTLGEPDAASLSPALPPPQPGEAADASAPPPGPPGSVRMTPAFIGLLGHAGALPLSYTERLAERELYQRDRAARAFLDIFNTRAVALFYAGWRKHRLALQYEGDGEERFLPLLRALAGLGLKANRAMLSGGEGAVFDQSIAHYAGALRQRPVSALMMQRLLGDYFGVALRIEQFVGAWYPVPTAQQTRLGGAAAGLGTGALAGERVHQRDLRLRLWFGPLRRRQFDSLLPGAAGSRALARWLGLLAGHSFEYEIRLVLCAQDVCGVALDGAAGRLGFDAFVQTGEAPGDRADTGYLLKPLH